MTAEGATGFEWTGLFSGSRHSVVTDVGRVYSVTWARLASDWLSLSEVVSVQSFERCSVFQMEAFVGAVIFTAAL